MTDARVLVFDTEDRVLLVPFDAVSGTGWTAPAVSASPATVTGPVWARGDLEFFTAVIVPNAAPAGARWWTLGGLLAERPPLEPAELVDLIRRQLPSCFA